MDIFYELNILTTNLEVYMQVVRHGLFLSSALTLSALGYLGYRVQQKSQQIPEDQRGNVFFRIKEVAFAAYQARLIEDQYTAKKHIDSVTYLTSKNRVVSDKLQPEINKVKLLYGDGYLQQALQDHPPFFTPVFSYHENLHTTIPDPLVESRQGFIFSGSLENLHSVDSLQDILNGNYIRCKSLIPVKSKTDLSSKQYEEIDILITGTKECIRCHQLKNAIVRDAAKIAAKMTQNSTIDPADPISDTVVFDYNGKEFSPAGNLVTMPNATKTQILEENFVACNVYSQEKTNSRRTGSAIVTGTTNPSACSILYLNHQIKRKEKK
jgi:hypothetical protein